MRHDLGVDIGRRYQENLVFDILAQHKILVLEFFFRDYFPQMYNFQASSEVHRTRQKITSICYQVSFSEKTKVLFGKSL